MAGSLIPNLLLLTDASEDGSPFLGGRNRQLWSLQFPLTLLVYSQVLTRCQLHMVRTMLPHPRLPIPDGCYMALCPAVPVSFLLFNKMANTILMTIVIKEGMYSAHRFGSLGPKLPTAGFARAP